MRDFKEWLLESKGIRTTPEIDQQIDNIMPQLLQAALKSKQDGEDISAGSIKYTDQYFKDRQKNINIIVKNDPSANHLGVFIPKNYQGAFNTNGWEIQINVAKIDTKNIEPRFIRSLLVHELIHSQDPKMTDLDIHRKTWKNNKFKPGTLKYHTQPREFDALVGQIVDSILQIGKANKGTENYAHANKILDDTLFCISNEIGSVPRNSRGVMSSEENWEIFYRYCQYSTLEQKQRMCQRIYNAVMTAKDILGTRSIPRKIPSLQKPAASSGWDTI